MTPDNDYLAVQTIISDRVDGIARDMHCAYNVDEVSFLMMVLMELDRRIARVGELQGVGLQGIAQLAVLRRPEIERAVALRAQRSQS